MRQQHRKPTGPSDGKRQAAAVEPMVGQFREPGQHLAAVGTGRASRQANRGSCKAVLTTGLTHAPCNCPV